MSVFPFAGLAPLGVLLLQLGCQSPHRESVALHRDDYGVPNIYAETAEGACFASGYAQAEDRLEELLMQYRRATGTLAEVFGERHFRDDYRARLWRHADISRRKYPELTAEARSLLEAYIEGVKLYMERHPEKVPAWAPDLEPWMPVALARYVIWGWPEGDAGGDLRRAGIEPDPIEPRASNQWVVAADRTQVGAPIALIDPHLGWYGKFRFYEVRLYGGDLEVAGVSILGLPFPSLGHNRFLSVAMTTGGPDAADVYEISFNPQDRTKYLYDGESRPITTRRETISVLQEDGSIRSIPVTIEYTHHGPIVAHREGKGYAMNLPYFEAVGLIDQSLELMKAKNLREAKAALGHLELMEQNVMIATVDGDIYYVRNGRVPVRPAGYDWRRPVPGDTSKTEWLGLHPLEDLVQITNPEQGYMQNCNVSPAVMMIDSPLTPDKYEKHPYLFNEGRPYLHQRAAQVRRELAEETAMSVERAIEIAHSTAVFNAGIWQERLRDACANGAEESGPQLTDDARTLLGEILSWNGNNDRDSVGAIAYYYWKQKLFATADGVPAEQRIGGAKTLGELALVRDRAGLEPAAVAAAHLVAALEKGAEQLREDWGRLDVAFGDMFRIGRRGSPRTFPIGGGSIPGMATPRALSFSPVPGWKTYLGRGGQTATQIVVLTKPPKSYSLLPLGQSDDPESPHFDDQAEKLMQHRRLKPTYFLDEEELLKHSTATTGLVWEGR